MTKLIVLLQALGQTPQCVSIILEARPAEFLHWAPEAERWSAQMALAHLFHAEALFQVRLINILAGGNPTLPRFGPSEATPLSNLESKELIAGFAKRRRTTLELLYSLRVEDWNLPAQHETQGATTLAQEVQTMINHDTGHLGQLYDLVERWEEAGDSE